MPTGWRSAGNDDAIVLPAWNAASAPVILAAFCVAYLLSGVTLTQAVPRTAGFRVDLGLAGIVSSVIAGAVTLIGLWMANRRADPAVEHLLAVIDRLEEEVSELQGQIAAHRNPPHRRKRRPDEAE